jgi:hypothetical protein
VTWCGFGEQGHGEEMTQKMIDSHGRNQRWGVPRAEIGDLVALMSQQGTRPDWKFKLEQFAELFMNTIMSSLLRSAVKL